MNFLGFKISIKARVFFSSFLTLTMLLGCKSSDDDVIESVSLDNAFGVLSYQDIATQINGGTDGTSEPSWATTSPAVLDGSILDFDTSVIYQSGDTEVADVTNAISVNANTGLITVDNDATGLTAGTYTYKVMATADSENTNYSGTQTAEVNITITDISNTLSISGISASVGQVDITFSPPVASSGTTPIASITSNQFTISDGNTADDIVISGANNFVTSFSNPNLLHAIFPDFNTSLTAGTTYTLTIRDTITTSSGEIFEGGSTYSFTP